MMNKTGRDSMVLREVAPQFGLPPLSDYDDGRGGHLSWVFCIGAPGLWYQGEWIEVDQAWIDRCLADFEKLCVGGYHPPVIREHTPSGEREGDILSLVQYQAPEGASIAACVRWAIPDAEEKIKRGQVRYFSPGIAPVQHSDTGEIVYTIRELSMTSAPHQKGATTHILAREVAVKEKTMNPELEALKAELEAKLAAQQGVIEALRRDLNEAMDGVKKLMEPAKPEEPANGAPEAASDESMEQYLDANPQVAALGEHAAKAAYSLGKKERAAFAAKLLSEKPSKSGSAAAGGNPVGGAGKVIEWSEIRNRFPNDLKAAEAEYKRLRGLIR